MIDPRLSRLLALSEAENPVWETMPESRIRVEYRNNWIFRPTGPYRGRLFFLWVNDDRSLGGSRCRSDHGDRKEPWRLVAYLPQKMVKHMFASLPPEEIARVTAEFITA